MDKPKRKVGRPTKYKPEFCQKLIDHMAQGLSYECFGAVINVATANIYEWEKKHPEFQDAKKEAFLRNRLFWEKLGIAGAAGKIKNFNTTCWIFNMKNRFRGDWRDKKDLGVNIHSELAKLLDDQND